MKPYTGFILVLASTILYASLLTLLKKANQQISPFLVISISTLTLFVLSLMAALIFEGTQFFKLAQHKESLGILLLVGIINFIGFWLAILAFKHMPIWQQSLFLLLNPILAAIFAYFILGEPLSSKLFIGLLIMSVGLIIAIF